MIPVASWLPVQTEVVRERAARAALLQRRLCMAVAIVVNASFTVTFVWLLIWLAGDLFRLLTK